MIYTVFMVMFVIAAAVSVVFNRLVTLGIVIFMLVITLLKSIYVVDEGYVYAFKLFGNVVDKNYEVGVQFVPPWYDFVEKFNIRNDTIEFTDEETLNTPFLGPVQMEQFDLNVPYRVSEKYAYTILKYIGDKNYRDQVRNSARSAARTVAGRWNWKEAVSTRQQEFAAEIKQELEGRIKQRLIDQGVDKEIASNIFIFSTPEVRKLLPPQAIRDAAAENEAAIIERERQRNLTEAEKEIAKRQSERGKGYVNLLTEISGGSIGSMTHEDMSALASLLSALADNTRADAFAKDIQKEVPGVKWGVITSGNPSVAVSPTQ